MAATALNQQPTPERFFNTINAYEQTEAMKAAVELELFTAIAEGNNTAETIATRCKAALRGVRILCDFLTIHGFLSKEGPQYTLAPDSALFLNQHSPAYIGNAIGFLLTPRLREGHARLTEAVRRGGTALGEGMYLCLPTSIPTVSSPSRRTAPSGRSTYRRIAMGIRGFRLTDDGF